MLGRAAEPTSSRWDPAAYIRRSLLPKDRTTDMENYIIADMENHKTADVESQKIAEVENHEITSRESHEITSMEKSGPQVLRHVPGRVSPTAYLLCVVELADRASFYGVSGILANFIQRPLPPGSVTGAPVSSTSSQNPGALGLGLSVSSALTLLLTFLVYVTPLFGGYIADTRWGRYRTIWVGSLVGLLAHVFFVAAALPRVIASGYALVPTVAGIVTMALSSGLIRPNLAPLLMDQYEHEHDVVHELPSGERVVVDRQRTLERMSMAYYWTINVGAFFLVATSFCERRVGYWLAFAVPAGVYVLVPVVLVFLRPRLTLHAPAESGVAVFWRVVRFCFSGGWVRRYRQGTFWEHAKSSRSEGSEDARNTIGWSDEWVDCVRQTLESCKVFLYFPMFNLTDGGLGNAQNAQAGAMVNRGIPNDLYANFNALTIVGMLPVLNHVVYPVLRRNAVDFTDTQKITLGFVLSATSQTAAAIIQHYIYQTSPCKSHASSCAQPSAVNGWWEVVLYVLSGAAECFANVTAYEVAYTRSPPQMRGVVLALFLLSFAAAAAVGEMFSACVADPYLVRVFAGTAVAGYLFALAFYVHFRKA